MKNWNAQDNDKLLGVRGETFLKECVEGDTITFVTGGTVNNPVTQTYSINYKSESNYETLEQIFISGKIIKKNGEVGKIRVRIHSSQGLLIDKVTINFSR